MGRSVMQTTTTSGRTNDSCVLFAALMFLTTLSIFSLHVGLYGALAILLTPHCLHSLDEEEAPCCRSGIGHCVALCYGTGPVFYSNVYKDCISLQDLDVG